MSKYRPYKLPVVKAFPNLKVQKPRISRLVIFLCRLLGRLYLFLFWGVAKILLQEEEIIFDAFKRALAGESRCIIAFRHPNGGEPQLMTWFFLFKLRALAARKGVKFVRSPHAVFIYSYEVVRYGGWAARFVMPNLGAMPIHHSKMDRKGMNGIYKAIIEGQYPVAMAPEGHVSYTVDAVHRIEPGAVRIGFNAAKQLKEKGEDCPVEILPLSIHFCFGSWGKLNMEMLLRKIEKVCGLFQRGRKEIPFIERLRQCRQHLLEVNEKRFEIKGDDSLSFEERLDKVINAALKTAERMMNLKSEGDFFIRLYKMRQLCWDRIFLPTVDNFDKMTKVEHSMLDLGTGEAWYISRYQELIDFCWYFRVPLPAEDIPLSRKIEYVQNLWDFANRTMGGAFSDRVSIFPRKVIIRAAPVISLSERLPEYNRDKKTAVNKTMSDLKKAYLDNIKGFQDC
ncbi:MAG: acyltransferase [Treponema sp.]|jgi:hypothetical protein|nr:acyltransferase [Treponema sp.]